MLPIRATRMLTAFWDWDGRPFLIEVIPGIDGSLVFVATGTVYTHRLLNSFSLPSYLDSLGEGTFLPFGLFEIGCLYIESNGRLSQMLLCPEPPTE